MGPFSKLVTVPIYSVPQTVDEVRRRLYDHITPAGYALPITRVVSALANPNRKNQISYSDDAGWLDKASTVRDDLWAEYLQIPKNQRHTLTFPKGYKESTGELDVSQYAPKNSEHDKWFKIKNLSETQRARLIRQAAKLDIDKNTQSRLFGKYFGTHTTGRGYDDKGEYASYYDLWDLAPIGFKGPDQSFGIGKPVPIYDRIYLDDYYGVNEPTHSTWLPEVTVYGGGKSNTKIKPKIKSKNKPWYVEQ